MKPRKHRSHYATRADFDSPWSLPFFRDPRVRRVLLRCAICVSASKRRPLTRQAFKRLYR